MSSEASEDYLTADGSAWHEFTTKAAEIAIEVFDRSLAGHGISNE
jgi:hypothetical protein